MQFSTNSFEKMLARKEISTIKATKLLDTCHDMQQAHKTRKISSAINTKESKSKQYDDNVLNFR